MYHHDGTICATNTATYIYAKDYDIDDQCCYNIYNQGNFNCDQDLMSSVVASNWSPKDVRIVTLSQPVSLLTLIALTYVVPPSLDETKSLIEALRFNKWQLNIHR